MFVSRFKYNKLLEKRNEEIKIFSSYILYLIDRIRDLEKIIQAESEETEKYKKMYMDSIEKTTE